jgi:hypothetical protein
MSSSSSKVLAAATIAGVLAFVGVGFTDAQAATANAQKTQYWSVSGGTVGVRWNRELAADLGLVLGRADGARVMQAGSEFDTFDLGSTGSLYFDVRNGNLQNFVSGALQARGGYAIGSPGGSLDLSNFTLRPRPGSAAILDVVGNDGQVWFFVDRLMYELIDNKQRLAVRTMDLRITPALAARLGQPLAAGWTVAELEMTTDVLRQGPGIETLVADARWHGTPVTGVPGASYEADLFMSALNFQYSRCDACTGAGGNGRAVFTPASTLRNNVNNGTAAPTIAGDPLGTSTALYAANIPWYSKFSGNFAPYNNDQHPFLIWNLYRFNADGTIDQIGRSGVKHAFLTLNTACIENPGNDHILGRGCSDVYSVSNNDSNSAQGPRSEIIPATNVWGRCGSIYDTNCDGVANASGLGNYDQRLVVRESQFSGTEQAGATYLFESWYLARGDINVLNSMATTRATFTRSGSTWAVGGNDQYKLGPAIDRWVEPTSRGNNVSSADVNTSEGRVKLAAKATDLGGGRWRYDYAVMNLDFSRAQTQGAEPNLRVLSNAGFNSVAIPVGSATLSDIAFSDGDLDATNDWTASISNGVITWVAPAGNPLNWGTLFRFSFITDKGPGAVQIAASLGIVNPGSPQSLNISGVLSPVTARAAR